MDLRLKAARSLAPNPVGRGREGDTESFLSGEADSLAATSPSPFGASNSDATVVFSSGAGAGGAPLTGSPLDDSSLPVLLFASAEKRGWDGDSFVSFGPAVEFLLCSTGGMCFGLCVEIDVF